MRKSSFTLMFVFAVILTMAFPAVAIDDVNEKSWEDVDCAADEYADYHFVLNRFTDTNQELTVEFTNTATVMTYPEKETRGTQHFYVEGGEIASASTSGDGWLVLSDWECNGKKIEK